jgi:3'-phosphoadenosine 5'-phosphosulfate sulfotransferase (PAPS reductase)/FAD synthetase
MNGDDDSSFIRSNFLRSKQSLPLESKVNVTKRIIRDFHEAMNGKTFVAYSGGKDSTTLLHLVRSVYPETPAVFVDTGLEYPELKDFVSKTENVITIRPEMNFKEVINVH